MKFPMLPGRNEPLYLFCRFRKRQTLQSLLFSELMFVAAASLFAGGVSRVEQPLVLVNDPPPIQMLVPGFTVRELPLRLNNINNLVYSPDGRLFALCYDGNVMQLKDTDGDGLEDTATVY